MSHYKRNQQTKEKVKGRKNTIKETEEVEGKDKQQQIRLGKMKAN